MNKNTASADCSQEFKPLKKGFNKNKKKFVISYAVCNNPRLKEIQNQSKNQCLGKVSWPEIDKIHSWMISAETATFMKGGGLGMIASELPEAFNNCFAKEGHHLLIVTPLYLGNTGKKRAELTGDVYEGSEGRKTPIRKIKTMEVPFVGDRSSLVKYKVNIYSGNCGNTDYLFLECPRFFSINPSSENPSAQDGCYVLNEFGINEVEKFAFFSKCVYKLVENIIKGNLREIKLPNVLLANDWHSGALAGLMKYFPVALTEAKLMEEKIARKIKSIPVIHIAHHFGYQGWDYENTAKILNSLYENMSTVVFKNAKTVKNSNPRAVNSLVISDSYNQAACNVFLADRIVTVSRNYTEEVSKELSLGLDFRDVLKIRKDHRNFFGIVNGYDKRLIAPIKTKIEAINNFFKGTDFKYFDEENLDVKLYNKIEFIKLISKIAKDKDYKNQVIPLVDIYKFADIEKTVRNAAHTPILCATSRLVEQKGYDIAAEAILNILENHTYREYPIFILGGAGDISYFNILEKLRDKVAEINPIAAKRIYVFRGYKDEFAYAIQLASDFYIMPSRFEPCGLTQMEAMAKGTLPIAMSTGGLVDTIEEGVDGFRTEVFFAKKQHVYGNNITAKRVKTNENAYAETLNHALNTFYDKPEKIARMKAAAMCKDFSWNVEDGSVYKYFSLLRTGHL